MYFMLTQVEPHNKMSDICMESLSNTQASRWKKNTCHLNS